jgi:hypothetical protein
VSEPSHERRDEASEHCEEVDALPVLAHEASVLGERARGGEVTRTGAIPAVQAAAVAAGGFVAGAAVVGLVTRRRSRAAPLAAKRRRRSLRRRSAGDGVAGELVQIVGSRSLLVDVHLLGNRG